MASGEGQSNPSTSGDAGGDHNEDFGNEYGPPLPTQEGLREMEHCRLVGEATNLMLNFAKDPERFAEFYAGRISWLRQYVQHIDGSTRETVAKLIGIVVSKLSTSTVLDLLRELRATFNSGSKSRFEAMHGAICATGYVLAQCSTGVPMVPKETLESLLWSLIEVGKSKNSELAGVVVEAIGHIGLRAPLLSDLDCKNEMPRENTLSVTISKLLSEVVSSKDTKAVQKAIIAFGHMCFGNPDEGLTQEALNVLLKLCRSKVEEILFTVGEALCFIWGSVSITPDEILKTSFVSLSNSFNILNDEGWAFQSDTERRPTTNDGCDDRVKARDTIVRKLFDDLLYSSRKEERCAGAVWLVSIITYCGKHSHVHQLLPDIQQEPDCRILGNMKKQNDKEDPIEDAVQKCKEEMQLFINKINRNLLGTIKSLEGRVTSQDEEIARLKKELQKVHSEEGELQLSLMEKINTIKEQEAFSHLLGEQNELTQEMASKGLSILYEIGDSTSKQELVKALVSTLSGTAKRKRAIKLTEDSEVFEEGTLGDKPGGGNITTYKELCSLANEMGQPDLIYKFMDLANHQASVNSKRGAAFGFARIAKQARDVLRPYLPSLVPKLVRYQYDPNRSVQDAMVHIWRSLVPEPKKTIDEFFNVVMDDLLLQAGSRLWRARESSCLALADVLQGRRFQEVEAYLEKIWVVCFRAMDDVKETVRTSGVCLSRSISSLTIRLSDAQLTSESEARSTISLVLPLLLSKGILSNIADVQRLSISIVTKIAKNAGSSIRPLLPDLIVCMLESLSSLEDQRLNYAELHVEKAGVSTERLESLRVAVSRDSPMWETLHFSLQQVDEHVLEILVPRLVQLVRSGVGLNTRVGVAKFISLLIQQQGPQMRKFAGILLKALKTVCQEEKSPSSRHAFVSACASIAKYAGTTQIQSLFEDTTALYDENTSTAKITSALLLRELSHQAHDVFVGYHALVLPTAFIARFDEDKTVSNIFEDIWEENTSGQSIAMQLYESEIVSIALKGLSNTSWTQKKRCAMAITKLADGGDLTALHVHSLLIALIEELSNRLWEGKEVLLDAVSAICKNCSGQIQDSSDTNTVNWHIVMSAVLAACSKKKTSFRNGAFSCLEQVLLHCRYQAVNEEAFNYVLQCCSVPSREEDGDQANTSFVPSLEKVLVCLKASFAGVPVSILCDRFEVIAACLAEKLIGSYSWQVKMATLKTIQTLTELVLKARQDERQQKHIVQSMEVMLCAIVECLGTVKVGQVRVACLQCMLTVFGDDDFRPQLVKSIGEQTHERLLLWSELEGDSSTKSLMQSVLGLLSSDVLM
ncbi:hypothetical protein L7F22_004553 [Adiantum nelumboides]|nr:hypothetical protein [Adiantum nelumboides]